MSSHVLLSIFKTVKTAVYVYGKSPKYVEFSHGHKHLNFTKKKKILVQLYTLFGVSDANKRRKESKWKLFFWKNLNKFWKETLLLYILNHIASNGQNSILIYINRFMGTPDSLSLYAHQNSDHIVFRYQFHY